MLLVWCHVLPCQQTCVSAAQTAWAAVSMIYKDVKHALRFKKVWMLGGDVREGG